MMKKTFPILAITAALALLASAFVLPVETASAQSCLSKPETNMAVRSGQARAIGPAAREAERKTGGKAVGGNLCRGNGGLVWIISIKMPNGNVVNERVSGR